MVTIAQVLSWTPDRVSEVGDQLIAARKKLVDLQDSVDDSRPPWTWVGSASDRATTKHNALRYRLNDITAEVARVAASVDLAAVALKSAREDLSEAMSSAKGQGFEVNETTGYVSDPTEHDNFVEKTLAEIQIAAAAANISDALTRATEADADLARALTEARDGKVDGGTGSLGDAADQKPAALDGMTDKEILAEYADDVAIETLNAFLDVEIEVVSWELEGHADATYEVKGDGSVRMSLTLEAGLGREISVGGAEADVSGGGTTTLELSFGSAEEAQDFLDGLDDSIDLGFGDIGNPAAGVAGDVARYVMQQDVTSFKTGVYGKASGEFDTPWARGEAEGRADGYYDWATDQYGMKFSVGASGEVGPEDSGFSGAAEMSGELKYNTSGELDEAAFNGSMSASVANERLGLNLPTGSSSGTGFDVQVVMDPSNPSFPEFEAAAGDLDLDRAAEIAYNDGDVVVRQVVVEEIASEEHEFDAKVASVEVEYGASAETATRLWLRPGGTSTWLTPDPSEVGR